MSRPTRATTDGRAYLDLQNMARLDGRATDELLQLYALEGFLVRLARRGRADRLVLKGGVLLAAFGNRRPTRDVDFSATQLANDTDTVLGLVREIAGIDVDDGLRYEPDSATAETIRDADEYSGVRVNLDGALHQARMRFHVDVNMGDSIWPQQRTVQVPRLLGGQAVTLTGYPLHMVHAEKIVTAVQRGTASTRWRDFGDIWDLIGQPQCQRVGPGERHRRGHRPPEGHPLAACRGLGRLRTPRPTPVRRIAPQTRSRSAAGTVRGCPRPHHQLRRPGITASATGRLWGPDRRAWQ